MCWLSYVLWAPVTLSPSLPTSVLAGGNWRQATGRHYRRLYTMMGLGSGLGWDAAAIARYGSLLVRISVHSQRFFVVLFTVLYCLCVIHTISLFMRNPIYSRDKVRMRNESLFRRFHRILNVKSIECLTECLWLDTIPSMTKGMYFSFVRKVRIEWQQVAGFVFSTKTRWGTSINK